MELRNHDLPSLFAQLGEASDDAAIARFIASHAPLPGAMQLHEAHFWTPAQAAFLCQAISEDADWAEVVDELNAELHARH
jgi:hypothetical protein